MKYLSLLIAFLTTVAPAMAQQKTTVLIVTNKEGKLFVDGVETSSLQVGETIKAVLDEGDHVIQLKTLAGNYTKTITCSDGKQRVINFEVPATEEKPPAYSPPNSLESTIADVQLDLPGSLSENKILRKIYAFDKGDRLSFDFDMINRNGTVNIFLYSYPDNALIYSKERVTALLAETFDIPKRGIYYFAFSTNHVIGRSAHFLIRRKALLPEGQHFNTSVRMKADTSYEDVLNTQTRVYSTGNIGHTNRSVVRISLPETTTWWVYWIGVGQEPVDRMKTLSDNLRKATGLLTANPLYAVGIQLITALPVFNSTATVDYRFADNTNAELFNLGNRPYTSYGFQMKTNVTADYSIVRTAPKELNLCLTNNSAMTGHDVTVRVGAFKVTKRFVMESEW